MRLTGPELRQVHDAIVQAFSLPDLAQVFQFVFDQPLAVAVNVNQPLGSATLDLLNWAQQRGQLAQLLRALGKERPDSRSLWQVLHSVGLETEPVTPPVSSPTVPRTVEPASGHAAVTGQPFGKPASPAEVGPSALAPRALDDAQSRVVREVLANFKLDELQLLVADHFPDPFRNLDSFVATHGRIGEAVIADLVRHVNSQHLANELVAGLRSRRPRDPRVQTLAAQLGLLGDAPQGPSPAGHNLSPDLCPPAPAARAPRQASEFAIWLGKLPELQFNLLRAALPLSFSSVPGSGPVAQRAKTLLDWAQGSSGPGLPALIQLARALWPQILTGGAIDAAAARADDWAIPILALRGEQGARPGEGSSPRAEPRAETAENTQAWERAAAALRRLLVAPPSDGGEVPSPGTIHAALSWLAWLRERAPWAPPTAILPMAEGGLLIERETEDEAGHLTTAELSLTNDRTAEFTLFRNHHVIETRLVPWEHAFLPKAFYA